MFKKLLLSISVLSLFSISANAANIDFNADGKADLLYRYSDSYQWNMLIMDGSSVTNSFDISAMSTNSGWQFSGSGDFNADGYSDVIIRNSTSKSWYIYNLQSNNIVSRGYVDIGNAEYIGVQAVADFNQDNYADVLLRNEITGEWSMVLLNNRVVTNSIFPAMSKVLTWELVDVADYDGNGSQDILIRNSTSGAWYIYLYNSTDIISRGYISSLTNDLTNQIRAVADFNGDGKSDLLYQNSTTLEWTVVFMDGHSPQDTKKLPLDETGAYVFNSSDDYDGDGKADVILRNKATGQLIIYLLDGEKILNTDNIDSTLNTSLIYQSLSPVEAIDGSDGSDQSAASFTLNSDAVKSNLILPLSATCDGTGTSIPLSWSDAPTGTQSFAITMHHYPNASDVGDLSKAKSYWTMYDIPASTTALTTGQTSVGTFGTNSVNDQQAYSAPCSQGTAEQSYTITLYALSSAVGSLSLTPATTDIVALDQAISSNTLANTTLDLKRVRYNPNSDDHVPTTIPGDCATKSAAFEAYSDLVTVSCDNNTMTVTTNTFLPYRSKLDEDKSNVGIKSWIGRVPIPEQASWTFPITPEYLSSTENNINIHHAIGISVEGVPILHYAKETTPNETAQLGVDYSDRDTIILGEIDQCGAHAGNGEDYHYHMAPLCMMDSHDPSQPLAYMFDGIPLYFGTAGGEATEGGTNYGGGRYSELNYLPQNVKSGERSLDECNAYDVNGDGSEYVYYSTKEAPYTIGCYRGVADQESSVPTGDHWKKDRDLSWAGSDVELTDHDTMEFSGKTWFFIEITPGTSNKNIAEGDKAMIMYRQLTSEDNEYDASSNCYAFRYRIDSADTSGSNDTTATHCR